MIGINFSHFVRVRNYRMALFLVFLLSFLTIESALGWGQVEQDALDDYVEKSFMPTNHIQGLIVTIVENNTVVVTKGYGLQNIEFNIPADEKTLMGIGSISKSFVGTLVAKTLHETFPERGQAVLDTPIRTLLPNGNFTFSDRYRSESMTFRDLMSHRSCLDAFNDTDLLFGSVQSIAEKKYRTRYQKESCQFRNGYNYNNGMTSLAAELIADIKGVPFIQMLMHFMGEIGMWNSSFFDEKGEFENNPHMSSGYFRRNDEIQLYSPKLLARIHTDVGAGGIISSAIDMAEYIKFHLNKGRVGDRQVIPDEVMNWIYTVANPTDAYVIGRIPGVSDSVHADNGYALGFRNAIYDGWVEIKHNGFWPPFQSTIKMYPDLKHGLFVVSNGPILPGGLTYDDLGNKIFSLLEETTPISTAFERPATPVVRYFEIDLRGLPTIHSPKEYPNFLKRKGFEARELIGQYGHPLNGDLIIRLDADIGNETLEMHLGKFGIGTLYETSGFPGVYSIDWKTEIMQHFYLLGVSEEHLYLDLSYENTAILGLAGGIYLKNENLGSFPEIPWLPGSCGPLN